jgi:hypothetical protein
MDHRFDGPRYTIGIEEELLKAGNGALRQQMVFEANRDLHELLGEIVERTLPQAG